MNQLLSTATTISDASERRETQVVLRAEHLRKRFGKTEAVADVSFDLHAGEVFGLLGPNGAGKTTTVSMLATRQRPSGGDAILLGHSIAKEPELVRKLIGVAPQEIALYPTLTAGENLRFFGQLYGVRGRELENRLGELLHFVGLDAHANNYVGTFSGGMKRRLNFAAALVHKPKLVMLDEPTAGVDPHSRQRIFEMVRTLRDDGHAIVYITHYMEEAEGLCDRIGIMNGGRIIAMGSLDDLLADMGCTEIIELRGLDGSADLRAVRGARGLCSIEVADDLVRLYVNNAAAFLAPLQKIISRSESPVRMKIAPISLEDLFLNLTGMELRD